MTKEQIIIEKKTLLKGFPEIRIMQLCKRSHKTEYCPHKGTCLNEGQVIDGIQEIINEYVLNVLPPKFNIGNALMNEQREGFNQCRNEILKRSGIEEKKVSLIDKITEEMATAQGESDDDKLIKKYEKNK